MSLVDLLDSDYTVTLVDTNIVISLDTGIVTLVDPLGSRCIVTLVDTGRPVGQ